MPLLRLLDMTLVDINDPFVEVGIGNGCCYESKLSLSVSNCYEILTCNR